MSLLCEFEGCIATLTVHHSAAMSMIGTYHNGIRLFRSHPSQPSNNAHSLNRIEALAQTVHLQPLEAEDAICSSCFLPTESAFLPPVDGLSVPQQDRRLKDDCEAFGRIAIGTASGSLHVVDVGTKAALHSIMCFPSQPMHTVLPLIDRSNPNIILAASSSQVAMVDLVSASATAELTLPERCAAVVVLSPSLIAVAQGNEVVTLFDLRQSHDTPVSHFVVAPQSQVTALACDEHGTLAAGTAEGRIAVFRALYKSCAVEEEKFAASASVVSIGTADRSPIRSLSITSHGKYIGAVDQLGAGVLIANRNATVLDEEEEPSSSSSSNALWSRRHYQSSDFLPPIASSNLATKDQGGEGRPFLKHLIVEDAPLKSTQKQTVLVRATIVDDVRGTSWYSERIVTTAQ